MTRIAEGGAEIVVVDLRGGPRGYDVSGGGVLVIDRADQLTDHVEIYRSLAGDRLVSGVVCLVVGERPDLAGTDPAVLALPDVLRHLAVLWVGDEAGVRWAPDLDRARPVPGDERPAIELLIDALRVPEVFERARAGAEELAGSVACPGVWTVSGGADPFELADARAAAVESLTQPGQGRPAADEILVRVARAGGAADVVTAPLEPGSPLHQAQHETMKQLDRVAGLSRELGTWRALLGRRRRTELLGTDVGAAGRRAENYRCGLTELLDRMDGHLLLGEPPVEHVTALGVPRPMERRYAEAAAELRIIVDERLADEQPLPDLAAELRKAAANAAPQGCAAALQRARTAGPLGLDMPAFRASPLSAWTVVLAFATCALVGFLLGPGWPGWTAAAILALAWAGEGWLLRSRRPDPDGELGPRAAAASALSLHGVPALLGAAAGSYAARFVPGLLRPEPLNLQLLLLLAIVVTVLTPVLCWATAVRSWRRRLQLAQLRTTVDELTRIAEDAVKREWLQVERRRAITMTLEVVAAGLEEITADLVANGDRLFVPPRRREPADSGRPTGMARAVQTELQDVVRSDLVAITRVALASSWVAAAAGRRAPAGAHSQLLGDELDRYAAHVQVQGLMTSPDFEHDPGPRDRLMARVWADSTLAYPALTASSAVEMVQACSATQLGYLRTAIPSARFSFAPRQVRRVLEQQRAHAELLADSEIVWSAGRELIGTMRLLPLRLESVQLLPAEVRG